MRRDNFLKPRSVVLLTEMTCPLKSGPEPKPLSSSLVGSRGGGAISISGVSTSGVSISGVSILGVSISGGPGSRLPLPGTAPG